MSHSRPGAEVALAFVLHAHLPFVRHPEHERFLEESWLFEACLETYWPLVGVLSGWESDRLPARIAISVSPPLLAMWQDPLLARRFARRLEALRDFVDREVMRTRFEPRLCEVARFHRERLLQVDALVSRFHGSLVAALAHFAAGGFVELCTTTATHALLPLHADEPRLVHAQVAAGQMEFRRAFGMASSGFWLPECAYAPRLEPSLAGCPWDWFVLDAHGLPRLDGHADRAVVVRCPSGKVAFARDQGSAEQVWSRQAGYPGDPRYRDFYRDAGYDLDFDLVQPVLPSPDHRGFTGIKYHAVTGGTGEKQPYVRAAAMEAVADHAQHFLERLVVRRRRSRSPASRSMPPVPVVAAYDAELLGHWWYEGPEFLDAVARLAAGQGRVVLESPGGALSAGLVPPPGEPVESSWGAGGHLGVWLSKENAWMVKPLRVAGERMIALAAEEQRGGGGRESIPAGGKRLRDRALTQAGRELLLAQASDWPFIVRAGSSPDYAARRFQAHLDRFGVMADMLAAGVPDPASVAEAEQRTPIFAGLDWRWWLGEPPGGPFSGGTP